MKALAGLLLLFLSSARAQTPWKLVWSDEFDGPEGSSPDPGKWGYDFGNNNGWGNRELETYTNLPANARLDGRGNLVIHVERTADRYRSARMKTQGLFSVQYGRIEARIKVPTGRGIWPAFWMLGGDIASAGWPRCGEIDIMENVGKEPAIVHASVHGPGYSGANPVTGRYTLPPPAQFADDFHTFAVEWSARRIAFFVDGKNYHSVTPKQLPPRSAWVFDHPFFVLLNVAVGGNFPGAPDESTGFPAEMLVDYLRIYQLTTLAADSASSPRK